MTKLTPKPFQERPADRFHAILAWLTTNFQQAKERLEAFQRCKECKYLDNCPNCTQKLENLRFDIDAYSQMAERELQEFLGGWYNNTGDIVDESSYKSFEELEQRWEEAINDADESIEEVRLTGIPEEELQEFYGCQVHVQLECFEGYKRAWREVCKVFRKEHELGMVKGWTWNSEGSAKEVGETRYDPSRRVKDIDAVKADWLALAARITPSDCEGSSCTSSGASSEDELELSFAALDIPD
ncbi:hypothetical protein BDZ45DRAFT_48720 [Acephala macrosclerotiorum]|nr:hypothetical protein BDZ45DRAFT_48720 [Acephala macrosclerotiorum]